MTRLLPSLRRALPLGLLFAALGCSGGLNCGSGCSNAYEYPQTQAAVPNGTRAVDDGIRMRMTQAGLDFIQANLRDVLVSQFGTLPGDPDTIAISLPGQVLNGSNPRVNLGFSTSVNGSGAPVETHPTFVLIGADELDQRLDVNLDDDADAIRVTITDLPVGIDARVYADIDLGLATSDAACDVVGSGGGIITTVTIDLLIAPRVGRGAECDEAGGVGECIKVDISLASFSLGDIQVEVLNPGPCTDGACTVGSRVCSDSFPLQADDFECASACGVTDFALDVLEVLVNFLENTLGGVIRPALEQALAGALEDVDGAPLSVSARQDIAGFAPGILPESALDLGFAIAPTGNAFDVNTPAGGVLGMDVILKSGFEAAPPLDDSEGLTVPHPCVRPIEGVEFADLFGDGVRAEFEVPDNTLDPLTGTFDGQVYHLGASLAKPAVNQVLFALYNTGALCIEVDSDTVNTLTDGAFQLSAATLDLLTSGRLKQFADADAPAIVALNPSQPPVVRFGAGTVDEGHLIVEWPDVEVSFYVLMFERFSRIFAVSADISLQLSVFNEPGTETLRIAIVDGPNVDGFEETYNELLPGVDFTEVLENLLGVVFDAALGDGLEFNYDVGSALSGALGVPIFIDFQGIETLPAGDSRQFLNVYLAMTNTPPQPRTVAPSSVALAREPGVLRMVDAEHLGRGQIALPTGRVRLDVDDGDDREFFARVDFGAWRGPLRADDGVLVVEDAKLKNAGEHTVTVRSRLRADPDSLEQDGVTVTVWVDAIAPEVRLEREGDVLRVVGSDDVTPTRALLYRWSFDDGPFSDFDDDDVLDLDEVAARRVTVQAQDLAGNVSRIAGLDIGTEKLRLKDEREAAARFGGGCASSSTADGAVAVVLLGLLLPRRRRAR